jgi:hypothetical protein
MDDMMDNGAHLNFSHLALVLVGGDTDHGCLPWLVSPPASENLKYTLDNGRQLSFILHS